ncbi:MAG: hypothetical protein GY716_21480 [bacterium]|nr:hypothetical protein [bacterium]
MPSFGEEIKRERELRDISLREVSESTKIKLGYLEALETNRFDELPGGVINRGFVRAYSECIGVDAETMVNAYLLEERSRGDANADRDPRVLRRSGVPMSPPTAPTGRLRDKRLWIAAAIGLVLILAAIWFGLKQRSAPADQSKTMDAEGIRTRSVVAIASTART